ncbi:MAG TPA: serine hydrolase [Cyclobacteriaceae bacterium]|nr:serine hydrolase [Cyclobacteriaceae bacterium]
MIHPAKQILLWLFFCLILTACSSVDPDVKRTRIDEFLNYQAQLNKFNGTVLIAQGDKILLTKGYGYRNVENHVPHDTSSVFQIYSITKTFTSTLIFKLIEQKKLSLTDPLNKFYPAFPNGDKITIEHLLTHTSGINDDSDPNAPPTEAYRVARFGSNTPHFAPGEGWSYCNGGYQLLGYIIQKVAGMSYEQAIRKNIFQPLGMSHSGFDYTALSRPEKSTAYRVFTNNNKQIAVLYDSAGPFSAGAIYATTGDLYKYYRSFRTHQIIGARSQEMAFAPSKTNDGYGYGWQLKKETMQPTVVSHSGGAAGFRSNFAMIPGEGICIIILNNHENANPEYLTCKILEILHDQPVELVPEVSLKAADLEKCVGAFYFTKPRQMMAYTSVVDGRLAIDVDGQGKMILVAKDANTFIQDEAHAELRFTKEAEGVYTALEVDQGVFQKMGGTRIESAWGIIGDATPKGWDEASPDLKLTEQKQPPGLWFIENVVLKKGEWKFRRDNSWNTNFGDNEPDKMLDANGRNIQVEGGVYDITLDLTDETKPRYTIIRKN